MGFVRSTFKGELNATLNLSDETRSKLVDRYKPDSVQFCCSSCLHKTYERKYFVAVGRRTGAGHDRHLLTFGCARQHAACQMRLSTAAPRTAGKIEYVIFSLPLSDAFAGVCICIILTFNSIRESRLAAYLYPDSQAKPLPSWTQLPSISQCHPSCMGRTALRRLSGIRTR
jgi:hypothetical protein